MLYDNRIDRWASSRARLFSVICAFFFVFGALAPAVAQDKQGEESTKKVLELIREGNKQYENEKYETAYESYTEAYELYPDPAILVRLGKTAEKLGKKRAAANYYGKYIEANPKDQTAQQLKKRLPELKKGLAPLIKVTSTPDGASVYFGEATEDNKIGETPVESEATAGTVTVIIEKDGYATVERSLDVSEGSTTELPVELKSAEPKAKTDEQTDDQTEEPALVDGPSGEPDMTQADTDSTDLGVWGWGTTGVGVALLGTGATFAVLSQSRESDVNNYDKRAAGANRDELASLKEEADSYYNTSVGLFVAGGVVTATGIGILTYHFLSADNGQQSAVRFNGGVTSKGGWVGLSGKF